MHLSERIFEERDKRGWSQVRLAEEAGISQTTVVHLENDKQAPRRTTLRRLAKALDLPLDELLAEVGKGKAPVPLLDLDLEQRRQIIRLLVQRDLPDPDRQAYRQLRSMLLRVREVGMRPAEFYRWYGRADVGEVLPELTPEDVGASTLREEIEDQTLTGV